MTQNATVTRLLELIARGRGHEAAGLYAEQAVLDATVPGWRFQRRGGTEIAEVWGSWFADAGELQELERVPTADGEVVRYLQRAEDRGIPYAAHHCHLVTVDPVSGLIVRDQVWCGGRWSQERLAEMAQAQHAEVTA